MPFSYLYRKIKLTILEYRTLNRIAPTDNKGCPTFQRINKTLKKKAFKTYLLRTHLVLMLIRNFVSVQYFNV